MLICQSLDDRLVDGALNDALDDLLQHTWCKQMRISPIFGIERGYWKNKAGYTATEVPCGWAGAVMKHANSSIWEREIMLKKPKNEKKNNKIKNK